MITTAEQMYKTLLIARTCHEVNRAYCEAIGDSSQLPWDEAPQWQKDSAIAGVNLHTRGNHGPAASHDAWAEYKLKDGWVYGEIKDEHLKTHPCLVSFDKLPQHQQAKDYIFRAIVHSLR